MSLWEQELAAEVSHAVWIMMRREVGEHRGWTADHESAALQQDPQIMALLAVGWRAVARLATDRAAFYERIIERASFPGDLPADPFA